MAPRHPTRTYMAAQHPLPPCTPQHPHENQLRKLHNFIFCTRPTSVPRLAAGTPLPRAGPCWTALRTATARRGPPAPASARARPPFPPRAPPKDTDAASPTAAFPPRSTRGRALGPGPAPCPRRPALTGEAAVAPPPPLPPSLPRAAVEKLRCRPLPAPRRRNGRFNLPRRPRRCPMMRPLPAPCRPRPLASTASHHSSPHARARPPRSLLPSPPPPAPLVCPIGRTCAGACGPYHRPRRGEIRRLWGSGGCAARLFHWAAPGSHAALRRAALPCEARSGTAQRCLRAARPASAPLVAEGAPRC